MDARERYFWDLNGYLVVKGALSQREIDGANDVVERYSSRIRVGSNTGGNSQAFAGTGRPNSPGFSNSPSLTPIPSADSSPTPPWSPAYVSCAVRDSDSTTAPCSSSASRARPATQCHGNGEPHRPHVAYNHQNGSPYVGGVTVAWQLTDCKPGTGGFACVPASHKSNYRTPNGVRTGDADMGVQVQPSVEAGDVLFFMDSAQPTARGRGSSTRDVVPSS